MNHTIILTNWTATYVPNIQWCNRWGGRGAECPPEISDWEISADLPGKKRQGKKEKGVKIEKKRRKIVKGKVENLKWKVEKLQNEERIFFFLFFFLFFFFFLLSLFKTTNICFGSTKMEIFYREKAFHAGKKNQEKDFAPSEKFSCYAPANICTTQVLDVNFSMMHQENITSAWRRSVLWNVRIFKQVSCDVIGLYIPSPAVSKIIQILL